MTAGHLSERFAFDAPTSTPDGFGGIETGWEEQFTRSCEVIYQRGSEAIEAARLTGRSIYKIKLRSDSGTRTITTDWRARDARRGTEYNVREVDAITDRAWVYLVVESGGATQ
ncbi:head-tail adaptor protein [Roseovarius sp.]